MEALTKRILANNKETDILVKEVKEYVNSYVDEGEFSKYSNVCFKCRGIDFYIYKYTSLENVKRESCDLSAPTTVEEMKIRIEDNRVALKCARQATMALRYINGQESV